MALYEATLTSSASAGLQINRWNYVSGGIAASVSGSFALAAAFGAIYDEVAVPPAYPSGTILAGIAGLVGNNTVFQQFTVINVYDPTDFYQTPFVPPYTGAQGGDIMPPFNAFGFRTNQTRRDVRRATKRFGSVSESLVASGGGFVSVAVTAMEALAGLMSDILEYDDEGNTLTFSPAVCGKEEYDPNPDNFDGNHRAYRYYPTLTAQLAHTATGIVWQPYATVRSQTSRQYGRGA